MHACDGLVVSTRSYREKGWLRRHIHELLDRNSPITAHQVSLEMNAGGISVHASAVFRALGELEREGLVRRLETTKAYVPKATAQMLDLICQHCGKHQEICADATCSDMQRLACDAGFEFRQLVAEVIGKCSECSKEFGAH